MPHALNHGWLALLAAYLLALLGVAGGVRIRRAALPRLSPRLLLAALLALIAGLLVRMAVHDLDLLGIARSAPWLRVLVSVACFVLVGVATGLCLGGTEARTVLHRGTRLENAAPRRSSGRSGATTLTFAGEALAPLDETKHFKLLGTTGTGKSTAIRELLRGALGRGPHVPRLQRSLVRIKRPPG